MLESIQLLMLELGSMLEIQYSSSLDARKIDARPTPNEQQSFNKVKPLHQMLVAQFDLIVWLIRPSSISSRHISHWSQTDS